MCKRRERRSDKRGEERLCLRCTHGLGERCKYSQCAEGISGISLRLLFHAGGLYAA